MKLKGVIFDMDGTVVDVTYDWNQIKAELNSRANQYLFTSKAWKSRKNQRSGKCWKSMKARLPRRLD